MIRRLFWAMVVSLACAQSLLVAQGPTEAAIEKVSLTAGRSTVVTTDFDAYSDFVVQFLLNTPTIASVNSSIVIRTVKTNQGLPTGHLTA